MRLLVLVMMMLVTAVKGMGDDAEEWERLMGEPMDKSRWIDPWDMGLASDKETRTCSDLESRVGTCEQELTAWGSSLTSTTLESFHRRYKYQHFLAEDRKV